jgi:hypothetical protein
MDVCPYIVRITKILAARSGRAVDMTGRAACRWPLL